MTSRTPLLRLPAALLLGALVLAGGLALARLWLPEWQGSAVPGEAGFVERYRELARRAGVALEPGEPRIVLATGSNDGLIEDDRAMDRYDPKLHNRGMGRGIRVRIAQEGTLGEEGPTKELSIDLSSASRPRALQWADRSWTRFIPLNDPPATPEQVLALTRLLILPGESLGELVPMTIAGSRGYLAEVGGSQPAEHVQALAQPGGIVSVTRHLGTLEDGLERVREFRFAELFWKIAPSILRLLAVAGLFLVLVSKGRIDVVNGAILAALTFVASLVPGLLGSPTTGELIGSMLGAGAQAAWVFAIWSAGESFLRAADPGFTTSLDALRAGRLGPRGGRSLLYGVSLGAAVAGVELAARAVAIAAPGAWPESFSVRLPAFSASSNPFGQGISLAGALIVVIAVVRRLVPARWVPAVSILACSFLLGPLRIHPFPLELAGNLAVIAPLLLLGKQFGMTTLLTASITSYLLPAAAYSAWNLEWLPGTFAATAGSSALLLVMGLVGLRRPEQVELERLKPPPFIRRLEEERRIKYEMDLLARIQVGLLPVGVPEIEGWEIAARSLLATEAGGDLYDFLRDDAGRLWIAAGDVAGHGYSCAIIHAMTTAALASLVSPERTPAQVLQEVDRVIRRAAHRNFASLVLLRLDPETGEALLSNAGHPYPLALSGGQVSEIEVPGLPLGQGPARRYEDLTVQVPLGGILVFCSDGLFEAVDWSASPYGFDRPQEVLRTLEHRSAAEIVDILLADWKRHLRSEEPPDDTTVVVVKRMPVR